MNEASARPVRTNLDNVEFEYTAEQLQLRKAVREFAEAEIAPHVMEWDEAQTFPLEVVRKLGKLGYMGSIFPEELGGSGLGYIEYAIIIEELSRVDGSVGIIVAAHTSLCSNHLYKFGTDDQKQRYLPKLASGEWIGCWSLTEPEAGSDAANVQTTATPSADGKTYVLNGEKRYITNGAVAQVLTVMARTPVPGSTETKVTAFVVTPDMPGFEVLEARMPKCGIRGTATARLAFRDMAVPAENVLGAVGKGLRLALTVLDFGRTTFGASCTGVAKACVQAATEHANRRVQFKQPIGDFELIKKKIAFMAASAFAMEATTSQCAAFIDRGSEDFMLETAMLKVWSTDALWTIVNDTLQIYGGQGYFTNEPYERWMRDARINTIGEGANEVLKAFIAVVGMRGVGEHLKGVLDALRHPLSNFGTLFRFGSKQMTRRFSTPEIPVHHDSLQPLARELGHRVRDFGIAVQDVLRDFRSRALAQQNGKTEELAIMEVVLRSQYMQERIADAACDLYASSCTLSRMDHLLSIAGTPERDLQAGRYFLALANRRVRQSLAALWDNDDAATTRTADMWLGKS
jgi:acyl-CoA dehydrogenase family member 9